jgi:hypothetical protein
MTLTKNRGGAAGGAAWGAAQGAATRSKGQSITGRNPLFIWASPHFEVNQHSHA